MLMQLSSYVTIAVIEIPFASEKGYISIPIAWIKGSKLTRESHFYVNWFWCDYF